MKFTLSLFFLFDIHNAFSANVNILEIIIVAISMFDVMLFKRMLSLMWRIAPIYITSQNIVFSYRQNVCF